MEDMLQRSDFISFWFLTHWLNKLRFETKMHNILLKYGKYESCIMRIIMETAADCQCTKKKSFIKDSISICE